MSTSTPLQRHFNDNFNATSTLLQRQLQCYFNVNFNALLKQVADNVEVY
jgi:hypothetical protein